MEIVISILVVAVIYLLIKDVVNSKTIAELTLFSQQAFDSLIVLDKDLSEVDSMCCENAERLDELIK